MSTGRSGRGRQGGDAGVAAGGADSWVAVSRRIELTADLHRVRVWCGGNLVADHARIWAKHQTIADPAHIEAAKLLRRKRFDIVGPSSHVEVEQRRLADYDALLGLDGPVA
jgi:transposase